MLRFSFSRWQNLRPRRTHARWGSHAGRVAHAIVRLENRTLLSSDPILVKDINPAVAEQSANPGNFLTIGSLTYFSARTPLGQSTLVITDGTPEGTRQLAHFSDAPSSQGQQQLSSFVNVNGRLFFKAFGTFSSRELWTSDGTAAGTVRLLGTQRLSLEIDRLTAIGDTLYFSANGDGTSEEVLWKSDGTQAGTRPVYAPKGDDGGRFRPVYMTQLGDKVAFARISHVAEDQLWVTDGTEAGTVQIPVRFDSVGFDRRAFVVAGDRMYFQGP